MKLSSEISILTFTCIMALVFGLAVYLDHRKWVPAWLSMASIIIMKMAWSILEIEIRSKQESDQQSNSQAWRCFITVIRTASVVGLSIITLGLIWFTDPDASIVRLVTMSGLWFYFAGGLAVICRTIKRFCARGGM